MSKRAVILAGGKGTRLFPYTVVLPKPLMPIGKYPILEVIIRQLVNNGFTHVTLAVNHQAEIIKAFFADGDRFNIKIDYSLEDDPLGTMGPLRLISDLPENFLVMNGDILTDLDYSAFYHSHVNNQEFFTASSYQRIQQVDYGTLETDEAGYLTGFKEKPTLRYEVSMGIYMLNRDVLKFVPEGTPYGFDELMIDLMDADQRPAVRAFDGYWLDIGRPDDYMRAIDEFDGMQSKFLGDN
jgi:NDP-sugar pyrophosphorylase family protein